MPTETKERRKPRKSIGPKLRYVLYVVFGLVALLSANSIYLAGITFLEWCSQRWGDANVYKDPMYMWMFLLHLILGVLLITPFVIFGIVHIFNTYDRKNRRAVRIGYALFWTSVVVLVSGILLVRVEGFLDLRHELSRAVIYWIHVACPIAAIWLYWLHRLSGPRIRWKAGVNYGAVVLLSVLFIVIVKMTAEQPQYSIEGSKYFEPSLARTSNGALISSDTLMNNKYCLECHKDAYDGWFHSVHHISSFNNPAYLASIKETRKVALERDGNVKSSRWCAGCHDPVPFFSGQFDDPDYDIENHETAHAGITCTVCHAITDVPSTKGNAHYVITEPEHYPFAFSENNTLKWINQQLIKAKPAFHKKTFLKPEVHKGAKFCSSCHKVHLPHAVTNYREFLRGQNHYDAFLLSGVSGSGITSFYYPKVAQEDCNGCHMPLVESSDFGAKDFAGLGKLEIHDHTFKGANTGIAWLRSSDETVDYHQEFLEGSCRVDIFGIREGNDVSAELIAPLNPKMPVLKPGKRYLLDIVVRTLSLGHLFTQGTVDSNEIWLEVVVRSGDRVIGRSGGFDAVKKVDPWAHYLNVFMLDKNGNRINRRNAQDIFVPLYNHQIPPGAAQTVHYEFMVPENLDAPITVETRLNYRKFDQEYMNIIAQEGLVKGQPIRGRRASDGTYINDLPVTRIAEDAFKFGIQGVGDSAPARLPTNDIPEWQRWNDYGIGLLLKGKAELRQASMAFDKVTEYDLYHGPLNLSRVLYREGRLDEALKAINAAASFKGEKAAPPWTVNWMSGQVAREMGNLEDAERYFRAALDDKTTEMIERKFDFSKDYRVRNLLGQTIFDLAKRQSGEARRAKREELLGTAIKEFEKVLALDVENVTAHYNLGLIYNQLGNAEAAEKHRALHSRYKADDNARDRAVALARQKYPAANHAAEDLVIYDLTRISEFEMTTEAAETQ